mmetsp:Transcript_55443/g.89640  ORF Transcript_55443/g.89640 Transcript_55443/m.89640 type:complete len:231 (+) Transcript_55443:3-695(+)
MTLETGGMPDREGTAELTNDPRFFTENVIDKRLAAFEAVAIVTEIMAAEAVKQCFELSKEFAFTGNLFVIAIMQLTGFIMMVLVMFMDLVACSVLSLQLFFTIRLMTAGPTGFDKAARFYTDRRMWIWRERAIFCVKWSIVGFMMSSGFMLCVKFYLDGAPEVEMESMHMKNEEYQGHKILAVLVLVLFTVLSAALAHLMMQHQRVFDESYSSVEMLYPGEMHAHLMTRP